MTNGADLRLRQSFAVSEGGTLGKGVAVTAVAAQFATEHHIVHRFKVPVSILGAFQADFHGGGVVRTVRGALNRDLRRYRASAVSYTHLTLPTKA